MCYIVLMDVTYITLLWTHIAQNQTLVAYW